MAPCRHRRSQSILLSAVPMGTSLLEQKWLQSVHALIVLLSVPGYSAVCIFACLSVFPFSYGLYAHAAIHRYLTLPSPGMRMSVPCCT